MGEICVDPQSVGALAAEVAATASGLVLLASDIRRGPLGDALGLPIVDGSLTALAGRVQRAVDDLAGRVDDQADRLGAAAQAYERVDRAVAAAA